jgi:hypothetical protein
MTIYFCLLTIHYSLFTIHCMTFGEKVIDFHANLSYNNASLPHHVKALNPYHDSPVSMKAIKDFYTKFYSDNIKRHLILGINPGRFGAGHTGIPFTDTKRLINECEIPFEGKSSHEPSSVFIYKVIAAMGTPELFYRKFYISSLFPLALVQIDEKGREKNINYYDTKELLEATKDYIIGNIKTQIEMGVYTDVCFCLGTGKNERVLRKLNEQYNFFKKIVALDHPRFIVQYKSAKMQEYVEKYVLALSREQFR